MKNLEKAVFWITAFMRWAIYGFGWIIFLVAASLLMQLITWSIFRRPFHDMQLQDFLEKLVIFSPIFAIGPRIYLWAKERKVSLPSTFSGWRYAVCAVIFWSVFGVLAINFAVLQLYKTGLGALAAIPLFYTSIAGGVLCPPAIIVTEILDWRSRKEAKP